MLDQFQGKEKTSWHAFTGPLLGIALAILVSISSTVSEKRSANLYIERNEKAATGKNRQN